MQILFDIEGDRSAVAAVAAAGTVPLQRYLLAGMPLASRPPGDDDGGGGGGIRKMKPPDNGSGGTPAFLQ